ncbi:glutathione S-transferase [Gallibacterium anatis]|uniref:glutathione S-transferase n=1 Tax=Gallibacterium anatis TaxID=750 RepID=UPI00254B3C19|nr:glutathione S-transferase [Gallibacterium anatis]WIM84231.1 glutathione S-transferase [Gallibacterium anatis]
MKLWYSPMSPFVRRVMIVLKHHYLLEQTELLPVKLSFDANSPHNKDNPLGRIPALQLNNGEWLFNSFFIAEYLDSIGLQNKLFPQDEHRWKVLSWHYLADGIFENTMPIAAERRLRPENEWWVSRHQQIQERNIRSFRYLEEKVDEIGTELNIGTISLVCCLDFFLFRQNVVGINIKEIAPKLSAWLEYMNTHYEVLSSTKPVMNK